MKRDEKVKLILEESDEESATAMSIFAQTVSSVEATSGIERHFVDSLMPEIATDENKIIELMGVLDEEHDLDGLREALQAVLKLELSTLPPYEHVYECKVFRISL